jgi:uncharacterized lipoprotein YajG
MKHFATGLLLASALFLAGCASGPKLSEMQNKIPSLSPDQGRIYFYRTSIVGMAVQPGIDLNGKTVGTCAPNGVFFADVTPGNYEASITTEVERKLTFTVEKGEEKFVRCYISMGFFVGHGIVELVDPTEGRSDIRDLAYTGKP